MSNQFWFLNFEAFVLLLILAPLGYFLYFAEKTRKRRLALFNLKFSGSRVWQIVIPFIIALSCILALTRPYWGFSEIELQVSGRDIFIVQDVSRSMLTRDATPSRLEFSRRKIEDLLALLRKENSADRVALVLFAGSGYLYCPPTEDLGVVSIFARSITTDMISSLGSNLSEAIKVAAQSIKEVKSKNPVVILISDGEDGDFQLQKSLEVLKRNELKLHVLGVGTPAGQPIELSAGRFLRDRQGQIVISRLEESGLSELAAQSGGSYARAALNDADLLNILAAAPLPESREQLTAKLKSYNEIGPLLIWVPLLVIGFCYVSRRSEVVFSLVAFLLCSVAVRAEDANKEQALNLAPREAYQAYQKGEFALAEQGFAQAFKEDPENLDLMHALASAQYKLGKFNEAAQLFAALGERSKGLQDAAQVRRNFNALYNLGNSHFKLQQFEQAIASYQSALELKPGDLQTEHNLEIARKLLEAQRSKENQDSKQQNQEQDQSQQDEQKQEQQSTPTPEATATPEPQPSASSTAQNQAPKASPQNGAEPEESKEQGNNAEHSEIPDEEDQPGSSAKRHDDKALSEQEAQSWLQSLQDDQVLLQRQRKPQSSTPEQTW